MKKNLRELIFSGIFAALLSVSAFLRIPLGTVPVTMQTLLVMLSGILLGKKVGAMACGIYLLLGLLGLPVFAQGGGFGYLLKPTFGYLLGFVLAAFLIGRIAEKKKTLPGLLMATGTGLLAIYGLGTIYYWIVATVYLKTEIVVWTLLMTCIFTTLPSDILWMVVAVLIGKRLRTPLQKFLK